MIKQLRPCVLVLCGMLMCIQAWGQNRSVSGTVLDSEGTPLPGAMISLKGTTNATLAGEGGRFTFSVPAGGTLSATFMGYKTKDMPLGAGTVYNIVLEAEILGLEEIVVVGYGTMKKKDLTGAVTQVVPDRIANENPKTVQDVLRGVPGLAIGYSEDNSRAKGGGSMQIRGQRSVYTDGGHNDPLLILDGMIFYGELSEINPDDIGQIDILKDASAAAVYGARAANGVVLITTKRGKTGKPKINFSANVGWMERASYRERYTTEQYMAHRQEWYQKNTYGLNPATGQYEAYQTGTMTASPGYYSNPGNLPAGVSLEQWRGYTTNGSEASDNEIWARRLGFQGNVLENYLAGKVTDWSDLTYRKGFTQDYNVSVSGANDASNYYFSLGYLDNEGTRIDDRYTAVRANLKVNSKVTDWLEVGGNVNFQDRSDGEIGIDFDQQLRNSPYSDWKDADGNYAQYPLSSEYSQRGYNYDFERQYLDLEKGYTVFNNIISAKVTLPFNITYTFNGSPRYQFFYDRYFMSAARPGSNAKERGVNREQTKRFDWSLNNTLAWDHTFNQKHHVMVTLAQEAEERKMWQDRIEARNIQPSDALGFHNTENGSKEDSSFKSADSHETADGLVARLFYSYDNRYMITTTLRRDGYSAFGSNNPYATFPSVALAWTFTNEKFMDGLSDVMSYGKLRVSYGRNGNRSLSNPYLALANLGIGGGKTHAYISPSGTLMQYRYLMVDRMANPNLQWEKSTAWNAGLDFGFLNNRISGSIEYYNMRTDDMIMNQRLPNFSGFSSITTNLGLVVNSGVELTLNTVNFDNDNFEWNTTVGFSYNKNTIKHLYYDYDGNGVEADDITNGWFIGKPISAIWNFEVTGIWQKDEVEEAKKYGQKPGDPKVANHYTADDREDGTPVYNDNDKVFLGQTAAPVRWSIRNDFTLWKDISFSFNIYSAMGHKSMSNEYMNFDDDGGRMSYGMRNFAYHEYWTPDNPTNKFARIDALGPTGTPSQRPSRAYNRSFVRLENISIGYTLPTKWTEKARMERVKVFASVRNAAVLSSKDWYMGDPETGGLSTRIYSFGINIGF